MNKTVVITAKGMSWDDLMLSDKIEVQHLIGVEQETARLMIVELHEKLRSLHQDRFDEKQPMVVKYLVCEDCEEIQCRCEYYSISKIEKEFHCCPLCQGELKY